MSDPTTTFPAYIDALKTNLDTRYAATPGLEKVDVNTAWVPQPSRDRSVTFLGAVEPDRDPEAMPATFKDQYDIIGHIAAYKAGKGDTVAKDVRDQCLAMVNVLNDELAQNRTQGVAGVTTSHVARTQWDAGIHVQSKKRFSLCEVTIRVRARVRGNTS